MLLETQGVAREVPLITQVLPERSAADGLPHMVRITLNSDPGSTRFGVQGSLTQAAASELRRCWLDVRGSIRRQHLMTVDLTDLTNIDALGKKVLLEMCRCGVMLTGSGVMTRAVIEEIARQTPPQKTRPGAGA